MLPLVLLVAFILAGFSLRPGAVSATNDFLAALDEVRIDDAYDSLCPATRQVVSRDEFATDFASADKITGYHVSGLSTPFGSPPVEASVRIQLDSGSAEDPLVVRHEYSVDEVSGGVWQVCNYEPLPTVGEG